MLHIGTGEDDGDGGAAVDADSIERTGQVSWQLCHRITGEVFCC